MVCGKLASPWGLLAAGGARVMRDGPQVQAPRLAPPARGGCCCPRRGRGRPAGRSGGPRPRAGAHPPSRSTSRGQCMSVRHRCGRAGRGLQGGVGRGAVADATGSARPTCLVRRSACHTPCDETSRRQDVTVCDLPFGREGQSVVEVAAWRGGGANPPPLPSPRRQDVPRRAVPRGFSVGIEQ